MEIIRGNRIRMKGENENIKGEEKEKGGAKKKMQEEEDNEQKEI